RTGERMPDIDVSCASNPQIFAIVAIAAAIHNTVTHGLARIATTIPREFLMARSRAYVLLLIVAAFFSQASVSYAEPAAYPVRPITMVVPTSAGGAVDVLARLIGVHLSNDLGKSVIIDNRAGAGGNIGTAAVARAAPDGHTIIFISGTQLINQLATEP